MYNEIAATRPDVIKTLADSTWIYDKYVFPQLGDNLTICDIQPDTRVPQGYCPGELARSRAPYFVLRAQAWALLLLLPPEAHRV